jgi:hypothetical protein
MTQTLSRAIGIAIVGARSRIQVGFGSWIRNDSDAHQGNRQSNSWCEDELKYEATDEQSSGRLWKLDKE